MPAKLYDLLSVRVTMTRGPTSPRHKSSAFARESAKSIYAPSSTSTPRGGTRRCRSSSDQGMHEGEFGFGTNTTLAGSMIGAVVLQLHDHSGFRRMRSC